MPWAICEGLLEHLEPVAQGREREAEAARLVLVPGGPDAEPRSAAGEDVQRGRGLDPEPRVPVVDAADHEPEPGVLRVRGQEPEGGHAFEHRLLGLADAADLEEVVHDPDRIEAHVVGLAGDPGERRPDGLPASGPGERADLQADLHRHGGYSDGRNSMAGLSGPRARRRGA